VIASGGGAATFLSESSVGTVITSFPPT
jgi:hypothetical protein